MRNWTKLAIAGASLALAACGNGGDRESARADLEDESIGGESVGATATGPMATGDRDLRSEPGVDDDYVTYSQTDVYVVPHPGELAPQQPAGTSGMGPGATSTIETDDARDRYTGRMTGEAEEELGVDRDLTGTGIGSTEPVDEDRVAQGMGTTTGGQPEMAASAQGEICPADIEGLNVRVSTIPRGAALVFTVDRAQVDELRDRLDRFASLARQQRSRSSESGADVGATGAMGEGAEDDLDTRPMGEPGAQAMRSGATDGQDRFADTSALIHQASEVRVVEIPRGARLEFRFDDSSRVRELRTELREDASALRDGRCPLSLQLEG